ERPPEVPAHWDGALTGDVGAGRVNWSRSRTGAGDRNRTRNLLFTKQLLCQLSYAGVVSKVSARLDERRCWHTRASSRVEIRRSRHPRFSAPPGPVRSFDRGCYGIL